MPATPKFHLNQNDTHIFIIIRVPYVRIGSMETHINKQDFMFYCKPYLLRIRLPKEVVDTETNPAKAVYDADDENGTVTIHLPKLEPGVHFPDLDLLTSLLVREQDILSDTGNTTPGPGATTTTTTIIQEIDPESGETKIPSLLPTECIATNDLLGSDPSAELFGRVAYGFGNQYRDVFSALRGELFDLVELQNPDTTTPAERTLQRLQHENETFDWQRYGADCSVAAEKNDPTLEAAMRMIPFWMKKDATNSTEANTSNNAIDAVTNGMQAISVTVTDDKDKEKEKEGETKGNDNVPESTNPYFTELENEIMRQLPRRTYDIKTKAANVELLSGLVDILYGCCYDYRMTGGESSTESNWTIFIHSRTLSWLDSPTNVKEAVTSSIRRSLCYPYMRCWSFTQLCLLDVEYLLKKGTRAILKVMLRAREIFSKSESRYLLNKLWVDDYCVWLQTGVTDAILLSFAEKYKTMRMNINKDSFDETWKLNMIEKCYSDMKIVQQAQEKEKEEENGDVESSSSSSSSEEEEEEEEKTNTEKELSQEDVFNKCCKEFDELPPEDRLKAVQLLQQEVLGAVQAVEEEEEDETATPPVKKVLIEEL